MTFLFSILPNEEHLEIFVCLSNWNTQILLTLPRGWAALSKLNTAPHLKLLFKTRFSSFESKLLYSYVNIYVNIYVYGMYMCVNSCLHMWASVCVHVCKCMETSEADIGSLPWWLLALSIEAGSLRWIQSSLKWELYLTGFLHLRALSSAFWVLVWQAFMWALGFWAQTLTFAEQAHYLLSHLPRDHNFK